MRNINLKPTIKLVASVLLIAVLTAAQVRAQATSSGESADGAAVRALFDLATPTGGPFPSNQFTTPDPSQNTGLRVNLPSPDCVARPSDCEDIDVINTLDGFNMQPRLSIPFNAPIDVNSVTSQTVFLIRLGDTLDTDDRGGQVVGINQIVWDTFTTTLHLQSDEALDQHTRYALIVTNKVRDQSGASVEASQAFRQFRQTVRGAYKQALLDAIHAARRLGVRERNIVTASVFTTQSATAISEKIRDQIKAATPVPADFLLGPNGERTLFDFDDVTGVTWNQQTRVQGPLNPVSLNLSFLRIIPGAVGQVAFGKYLSPDYAVHPGEYIPPVGTRTGTPVVQGMAEIYFNLYLPSGPKPAAGWPVAILGHGSGASRHNVGLNVAAMMAHHGIATIGINWMGHGFGPLGTLTVNQIGRMPMTLFAGGRGIDQNRDGQIHSTEGSEAAPPRTLQFNRGGYLQSLGDLMQMVRVIEVSMDVDGDGSGDLDPSRIYYFGASLGGSFGTNFMAVEPHVRATVANVPGGPLIENRRLATPPTSFRPGLASLFAARQPSLINSPGISGIAGVPVPGPSFFYENIPLRNGAPITVGLEDGTSQVIQSPVINTVVGAMALQEWFDRAAWASQAFNPVAYAPHLRKRPLPGVSARPVLFQFAKGDQSSPNPNTTAILRAGDLADRATFYRHDLAYAETPELPKDPHLFTVGIGTAFREIALEAQRQVVTFFASDGTLVIHPEPARFFEVPISSPLPEDLSYIP